MAATARLVPALSEVGSLTRCAAAVAAMALAGGALALGVAEGSVREPPDLRPSNFTPGRAVVASTGGDRSRRPVEIGTASWYGLWHHGRPTASGEPFDMYRLTAAHPWLPLGTRLTVTNLANGRSIAVRVNDRGPYVPGRIIDLSYAAARRLGAVARGVFPVQLHVLAEPDDAAWPDGGPTASASLWWWISSPAPAAPPPSLPLPVSREMPEVAPARSTRLPSRRS